ncbi:hypothetical protein RRG08_048143 [Elysia crispata]|uniref:Uncharacterized protein n=1 Tax=Elysia crispata TaxID=231223 RepID=A0AAE1DHS5_9GAST|nr:hypothetical protein RRG08_048143 [Elysia crispata]
MTGSQGPYRQSKDNPDLTQKMGVWTCCSNHEGLADIEQSWFDVWIIKYFHARNQYGEAKAEADTGSGLSIKSERTVQLAPSASHPLLQPPPKPTGKS